MSAPKKYVAEYAYDRTDGAWNVRIVGLDGCQTYGRSFRQAQHRIREALALWLDIDAAEDLQVEDRLPSSLSKVADSVLKARREAEQAGAKAQSETAGAVRRLTDLGLSRRDAAEVLGLSHQRVQQLLLALCSFNVSRMFLGFTFDFVISAIIFFSSSVNLPAYGCPTKVFSNSWL